MNMNHSVSLFLIFVMLIKCLIVMPNIYIYTEFSLRWNDLGLVSYYFIIYYLGTNSAMLAVFLYNRVVHGTVSISLA